MPCFKLPVGLGRLLALALLWAGFAQTPSLGEPVTQAGDKPVLGSASPPVAARAVVSSPPANAKKQDQGQQELPVDFWLWLAATGLLSAGVLALLAWHPRFAHLGLMQVQGLILIRLAPDWNASLQGASEAAPVSEQLFQQSYQQFAQKYQALGLKLDFMGDGMRLVMQMPASVPVYKDGIPERLCSELQALLAHLPAEKYFLQVHLEGRITGLRQITRFSLACHGTQLGLHLDVSPRFRLKGVFFNG